MKPSARTRLTHLLLAFAAIAQIPAVASDPEPAALTGQVLGDKGRPIVGAIVRFRPAVGDDDGDDDEKVEPQLVHTGEDGRFSSGETTSVLFDFRVHAEGYAFRTFLGSESASPLTVQLERGRPLVGRVVAEATGDGIGGATVRLDDGEGFDLGGAELEVVTDDEGHYRFPAAPHGAVRVRGVASGRAMRSIGGTVGTGEPDDGPAAIDDLWLPEGGTVAGRVVGGDGKPIEGADIWIVAVDNLVGALRNRFRPIPATSDVKGRFELEGVTAGTRYRIRANAPGHAPGATSPFTIDAGTELEDVTVTLRRGAALRLRLVDSNDRPVTGVTVQIETESRRGDERSLRRYVVEPDDPNFVVDEEGWITLRHLPPGTFSARLEPENWRSLDREGVVLVEGETTELEPMTVEQGAVMSGRVVDRRGKPISGAGVEVRWQNMYRRFERRAESGTDGKFRLGGLPEHSVTLEASAEGFADRLMYQVEHGEPVTVELRRNGGIRGKVSLAEGGTPESFTVRAVPRRRGGEAIDDAEITGGAFELRGLAPGTYAVEVRAPGLAPGRVDKIKVKEQATVDVGEFRLETGLTVRGRVIFDVNGAAAPGTRIRIDRNAGPTDWGAPADGTTISENDGSFAFDGLGPGRYTLTIVHAESAPMQHGFDLDSNPELPVGEIEIRLTDGGEIRGTVVDAEGLPVDGVDIFMIRGAQGFDRRIAATLDDGSFRFDRLAPGTYTVWELPARGRTAFGARMKTVNVRAGETKVVKFAPPDS